MAGVASPSQSVSRSVRSKTTLGISCDLKRLEASVKWHRLHDFRKASFQFRLDLLLSQNFRKDSVSLFRLKIGTRQQVFS